MPSIAIFSSVFPTDNAGYQSYYLGKLSQALTQQGYEIHVITTANPLIAPTLKKVNVHKIIKSWGLLDLRMIGPLFQKIRPEIIHIIHPTELATGSAQFFVQALIETNKVLWKLPILATLFNINELSWFEKIKLVPILAQCSEITVPQDHVREEIAKLWPPAGAKIQIVNIGAKEEEFFENLQTQKSNWDLTPTDKVICFMSDSKQSGFEDFIDASADVLRKNKNLKVIVPSRWKDPNFRYRIIQKLEREQTLNQFIFTGELNDKELKSVKQSSDLFVFLEAKPLSSNFPWQVQTTLRSQSPTLCWTESQVYNEFGVVHGENIWLSPFKNIPLLSRDLEYLIQDDELRNKLAKGAAIFQRIFNFDFISNEMSRCYSKLLRGPHS
jgi:glycosyltransferase involved in cell wall biosynthesis